MFPITTSVARDPAVNAFPESRLHNSGQEHLRRITDTEPSMTLLPLPNDIHKVSSYDISKGKKLFQ